MTNIYIKLLFLFVFLYTKTFAAELIVNGNYYGENIYILNSSADNIFCTDRITINNKTPKILINSSSYEIDFKSLNISFGDAVEIKISYKDGCIPKVLNPDAIKFMRKFSVTSMNIDKTGILTWEANAETDSTYYVIEQFRWKKWVQIGKQTGKLSKTAKKYTIETHPHYGPNLYRIRQFDKNKETDGKLELKNKSTAKLNQLKPSKSNNIISFLYPSQYEIVDMKGTVLNSGFGNDIDISEFPKGKYFICFDNLYEIVTKK